MQNQPKDFYQMNAGAHRRHATSFTAPALTWYRAFWIDVPTSQDFPDSTITDLEGGRKKARIALKDKIDEFVVAFHRFILTTEYISETPICRIHPSLGGKIILFNRVIDSINFIPISDDNLTERETDVLYSDNRVVVMEFNWEDIAATVRIEIYTEYFSITTIAELHPVSDTMPEFRELIDYLQSVGKRPSLVDIARADSLRKSLFFEFWDHRLGLMADDMALGEILTDSVFRNLFADFRGLVISNKTFKLQDAPKFGQSEELAWGKQIDFKLLPLFTEIKQHECTASYMLDGRALYMTTLGPQMPEAQDWNLLPMQYIFYIQEFDHQAGNETIVSKWQLGRLVDGVHLLDTVRLAALKYLPQLLEASTSLSGLDAYVKKVRSDLTHRTTASNLRQTHQYFANITTIFGEMTRTDTGLLDRIERSRYYVEQFNANVGVLRIKRLEGYQRYDEFVRHRLGPVFDFINRLGIRYESAVGTLSLLDFYSSTRTQQIGEDIRTIQAYGEVVLFGALVPYYLTSLAEHVIQPDWMKFCAIAIFVVFLGVAAWRYSVFKERDIAGQIAYFIGGALFAGLVIVGLHYLGLLKPSEPMPNPNVSSNSDPTRWGSVDPTSIKYLLPAAVTNPSADAIKPAPPPHVTKVKRQRTRRSRHAR
jgi:hypothetical protein